jgi:hypothetical protein
MPNTTIMETNRPLLGIWKIAFFVAAAAGNIAAAPADADKVYSVLRTGDLPGLRKLLENGISPNWADSRQITLLMGAATRWARAGGECLKHQRERDFGGGRRETALHEYI